MQLTIYVPRPGSPAAQQIAAGSGIVGDPEQARDGRILVYYEGNLNNVSNMQAFPERLLHAAGRLVKRYPTVAFGAFKAEDLIPVATYDGHRYAITSIEDPETLSNWAGEPINAIFGPRYAPGTMTWDAAYQAYEGSRRLSTDRTHRYFNCMTKGGQVLIMDAFTRTGEILADDDPRMDELFPKDEGQGLRM